jgi:hypothetical protein
MTSRERLLALIRGEPTDRIGVHLLGVRPWTPWWLKDRHPSYAPLIELARSQGDILSPIGFETGFCYTAAPLPQANSVEDVPDHPDVEHHVTIVEGPHGPLRQVVALDRIEREPMTVEHYVKTPADAENVLAIPYVPLQLDMTPFVERDRAVGPRGLAMIGLGCDPIGLVHGLLGTERLAVWSVEYRDLLHRMLREFLRRLLDVVHQFAVSGLHRRMPLLFFHTGAEIVAPPIHGPADFHDFVTRYDTPLHAAIHEAGGWIRVHCHGRLDKVLEEFVAAGVDILQPVEPLPEGDVLLSDAKQRIGDKMVIEGNLQFSRLMTDSPDEFRRLVEHTVAEGKPGGRFILCPTASPWWPQLPELALTNYRTMVEVALSAGRYD